MIHSVQELVSRLGIRSTAALRAVRIFYGKLSRQDLGGLDAVEARASLFRKHAGPGLGLLGGSRSLGALYGIDGADPERLVFSVHTYYALVAKLLVAGASGPAPASSGGSFLEGLRRAYTAEGVEGVRRILEYLEGGDFFRDVLNVTNFPGMSHFSWYLGVLDRAVAGSVIEISRILSTLGGALPRISGKLLRELYQDLVPSRLRRAMGEYYTPGWLASAVLERLGLDLEGLLRAGAEDPLGPLRTRILDPACGSGSFLIPYIEGLRRYAEARGVEEELPRMVAGSVFGVDLSPLAVLSSRAGYVLSIADLLPRLGARIEVPVYLADSTAAGDLPGPPLSRRSFDYVVGNPPWISWDNLPETYRRASKGLWDLYGLSKIRGWAGLGKVKRDFSMLFVARSLDLYLRRGGILGLLIPLTLFKTQAGAGFRSFLASVAVIREIHDLVLLRPFGDAVNRTALLVAEKVCEVEEALDGRCVGSGAELGRGEGGVPHVIWRSASARRIPSSADPEEAVVLTSDRLVMAPLVVSDPSSPWIQASQDTLRAIRKLVRGVQFYRAHAGVNVALNQVYYVRILERLSSGILRISNAPRPGQKKRVRETEALVEAELVYPLARGRDVKRWHVDLGDARLILPHDPADSSPFDENAMKTRFPLAYRYFEAYREELERRSIHRLWGVGRPFYTVYDIGRYTFSPYKVVWKNISGAVTGKADFSCAVLGSVKDPYLGEKLVIPNIKLVLVPVDSEEEAHYLAGILNSIPVRAAVASYVVETEISAHVLEYIKIPRYDPGDYLHNKISQLSAKAHRQAERIYIKRSTGNGEEGPEYSEEPLEELEREIDLTASEILGISRVELEGLKALLKKLSRSNTSAP